MEELVGKKLAVPAYVLGNVGKENLTVAITISNYLPNYCGQRCYVISTGWTNTTVSAEPIYRYWYNEIRKEDQFKQLVGTSVLRLDKKEQEFTARPHGKVQEVTFTDTFGCLHVRVYGAETYSMPHVLCDDKHHLALVKAGQLRDLNIALEPLSLNASDTVILLVSESITKEELSSLVAYSGPFFYSKIGCDDAGVKIMSDRITPSQLVERQATFDVEARHLYEAPANIASQKLRCRAVAFDAMKYKLYIQVLANSAMPEKEGDVIALKSDLVPGIVYNIESNALNKVSRPLLNRDSFTFVLEAQKRHIEQLIMRKGYGVYSSRHEILGIIEDEVVELRDAIHDKLDDEAVIRELQDIASGAMWAIASMRSGAMSW